MADFFAAGVDLWILDNIIANSRKVEQHLTAIYAQSHRLVKSKLALYVYSISVKFYQVTDCYKYGALLLLISF